MEARKKILLIDDDPVTHLIFNRRVVLLQLHWDLRVAQHPAKVLWKMSETDWQPDLAIIDHHLPDLKGPALVELLRQHGHHFPWVWISSSILKPHIGAENSPEAFFVKPITTDALRICDTLAKLSMAKHAPTQA